MGHRDDAHPVREDERRRSNGLVNRRAGAHGHRTNEIPRDSNPAAVELAILQERQPRQTRRIARQPRSATAVNKVSAATLTPIQPDETTYLDVIASERRTASDQNRWTPTFGMPGRYHWNPHSPRAAATPEFHKCRTRLALALAYSPIRYCLCDEQNPLVITQTSAQALASVSSTRRFCALPVTVLFGAIGSASP